jgi:hypothetical protein
MQHASELLDGIVVSAPCQAAWEKMPGSDTVRHCAECGLQVHNLSGMTQREAESVLSENRERLCVRLLHGPDGAVVTVDKALRQGRIRRRLARFGAALMALCGFPSCMVPSMGSIDVGAKARRPGQAIETEPAECSPSSHSGPLAKAQKGAQSS